MNIPEIMRVRKAAETLGITRQAVYEAIDTGALPGLWHEGRLYVPAEAVASYKPIAYGKRKGQEPGKTRRVYQRKEQETGERRKRGRPRKPCASENAEKPAGVETLMPNP